MNDNTVLRIKVPAHLYESVKEQLTLKEAKSGKAFGDWKVVKEKKLPKDGMKKVEEEKVEEVKEEMPTKKERSLDELKAVKEKLENKINEMEKNPKVEEKEKIDESEMLDMVLKAIGPAIDVAKDNAGFLSVVGGITGIAKMIADKIKQDPEARKNLDKKTGSGSTDTNFLEVKKKDAEDKELKEASFSSTDVNAILKAAKIAVEAGKEVTIDGVKIAKVVPGLGAFISADNKVYRIRDYYDNMSAIVIDGVPAELKPYEPKQEPQVDTRTPEEKAKAQAAFDDRYGPGGGYDTAFGRYTGD